MAEPLLKRTFSRLRAKERFRRKTDPKLTVTPIQTNVSTPNKAKNSCYGNDCWFLSSASEVTGKVDLFQSSSSTASTSGHAETESSAVEECTRRSQITVSKKQNWAKLPSTSKDPANTDLCTSLVYGPQDWDLCSGKAEVPKQACSQRTLSEDGSKRNDLELEFGYSRTPYDSVDAGLPELTPASTAFVDVCVSSSSAKISGQGAYLQHLDRSSRAWVLSTGKPQSSDEVLPTRITELRQGPGGDGNIWYNPIPEEDDSRATTGAAQEKYGDPWRRRETEEPAKEKRDQKRSAGLSPTGVHQMREIQTEADIIRADSSDLIVLQSDCISSASGVKSDSPRAPKKTPGEGGSCSSAIDKIKSPGTVRRLSMKMRKLPELRRKLSLRSSRNQRSGQGNASSAPGASDEASPPNARKESSNVISKYHLDSSAPARPRRRSSRTRSASKGGYLSDGDSPELLPKQGSGQGSKGSPTPPPHLGPRDSLAVADAESFRLYSLEDQPRCAQRLSGLLTVHLLGVDELLRSSRNDATKEVFCAIQVDGVTRARTSLLTCRGACLPLNHTFNLELERARLLKLVILTPTNASGNSGSAAPAAPARNRVCCIGAVAIPHLFKALQSASLVVVGLYRLCGSAAVKKELRDAFERDSAAVTLNDELYPDVNVITGHCVVVVLCCDVVVFECIRATLSFLLDHLSLVASYSDSNRMTCQNLAVCFGPVLLTPTQESWQAGMTGPGSGALAGSGAGRGGRSFAHSEEIASAVDFKRHIEALHYLLQLWPGESDPQLTNK
ncbi:hypothetical protein cypCar_00038808 [Cyprinus carpio]|nr:hypothetical protein cypCar_00038808 [Cyprinus carpio]